MSHILQNANGTTVSILPLGGIIQGIVTADSNGNFADIVLGFDTEAQYESTGHPYFGALIGRYTNRIAGGRFSIDGTEYVLGCNAGPNHLHGGFRGFDKVRWRARAQGQSLRLAHVSADGEEGYPGELTVTVDYALDDNDTLRIDYRATTTRRTPVNLTIHPYFNLAGHDAGAVYSHELEILAQAYTPVDDVLIPLGNVEAVQGTPLDFRTPMTIGERIIDDHPQLLHAGGYDHNWVLDKPAGELQLAARVTEPVSGRVMEVLTTEPGLQFYSGNSLHGIRGKGGASYGPRSGFCLETQHFPDSPNQPTFPSAILEPGDLYASTTIYRFSTIAAGT